MALEKQNTALQEHLWKKCEKRGIKGIDAYSIPEFKYIYCSPAMIKQIENAFAFDEVSFPTDNFAKYL